MRRFPVIYFFIKLDYSYNGVPVGVIHNVELKDQLTTHPVVRLQS
jgi:hypothetical protein